MNKWMKFSGGVLLAAGLLAGCGSNKEEAQKISESDIEKIVVSADHQNVIVEETEGKEIKVVIKGGEKPKVVAEGSSLQVEADAASGIFNFKTPELRIELPKKQYQAINIETVSGKASIEANSTDKNIQTDSGDITLFVADQEMDTMNINLSAATGKIKSKANELSDGIGKGAGSILKQEGKQGVVTLTAHTASGNIYLK